MSKREERAAAAGGYREHAVALEQRILALETNLAAASEEKNALAQELAAARRDLAALDRPSPPVEIPSKRKWIWLSSLAAILIGAVVWSLSSSPPPPSLPERLPLLLEKLEFGATLSQSAAVLRLEPVPSKASCAAAANKKKDIFASVEAKLSCEKKVNRWQRLEDERGLSGPRRITETLLFGEPARCHLSYAVGGGLSRIACLIEPLKHRGGATWQEVAAKMRARFGTPTYSAPEALSWTSRTMRLRARFSYEREMIMIHPEQNHRITVVSVSSAHLELRKARRDTIAKREHREASARQKEQREAAERRRRERIERLQRTK